MLKTTIRVTLAGSDISQDLTGYLTGFTYTDRHSGEQDDIALSLQDRYGLWRHAWFPSKGDRLQAVIETNNRGSLSCGIMEIDQIEISGPPSTCVIRAVAIPVDASLRNETKSRAWATITLENICKQIAGEHKLGCCFMSEINPSFERVDQRHESDSMFLLRLANENGLQCKVGNEQIIVYSQGKFDAEPAVLAIDYTNTEIIKAYSLSAKIDGTYCACETSYWDVKKQQLYTYTFQAAKTTGKEGEKCGSVLKLNQRYESQAEAMAVAESALKSANSREREGSITLVGSPGIAAGQNIDLFGFGELSGKYSIAEAEHSYTNSSGYETKLKLRTIAK